MSDNSKGTVFLIGIGLIIFFNFNFLSLRILGYETYSKLNSRKIENLQKDLKVSCHCKNVIKKIQYSKVEQYAQILPGVRSVSPTTEEFIQCNYTLKNVSGNNYEQIYLTVITENNYQLITTLAKALPNSRTNNTFTTWGTGNKKSFSPKCEVISGVKT